MTEEGRYDAVIVGAGFSGIHQLINLRRLGLHCTLIEAGSDLGGSWYWNRYPGARVDCHIPNYELPLPELWRDWTWTEKFPGWQELQAYFTYVGDKMNLRSYCRFNTVVKQAHWDNQLHLWHVTAQGKEGIYNASARYLILCLGFASKPYIPDFKGRGAFKGPCCHTSRWPKEGLETAGKRVGIIGTGASGVQLIQEIGPHAAHLTVFQRTPNLALPMGQYRVTKQVQDHFKPLYKDLFEKLLSTTHHGLPHESIPRSLLSDTEKEREANFDKLWDLGGFNFTLSNYEDVFRDKTSNEVIYKFWRRKVGERIKDPEKRALLAPEVPPHVFGGKRPSLEQHYYEVLDQSHVDLVNTKMTPILEICENGLKTTDKEYEFDILIFATGEHGSTLVVVRPEHQTGFDTYGGFNDIDLRGLNGETIQDHWKDGVRTYLGLTIDNFPNLFFVYGPQGPAVFSNGPISMQIQGSWIAQTIAYLREHHVTKFVPTTHAALTFKKHFDELCNASLLTQVADSWYLGGNIPGRKREVHSYVGGLVAYKKEITEEIERGYPGFLREALTRAKYNRDSRL